jgi:hypothetical protein
MINVPLVFPDRTRAVDKIRSLRANAAERGWIATYRLVALRPRVPLATQLAEAEARGRRAGRAEVIASAREYLRKEYVQPNDPRTMVEWLHAVSAGSPTPPPDAEAVRVEERKLIGVALTNADIYHPIVTALLRGERP